MREAFTLGRVPLDVPVAYLGPKVQTCPGYRFTAKHDGVAAPAGFVSIRRAQGIHMPRWASRLVLPVISCRLERLHDVTEEEARREGVPNLPVFTSLWDALNAKRGERCDWLSNPLVWRVEFGRPL